MASSRNAKWSSNHVPASFKKFGFSTAELKYGESAQEMKKYPYYGNTAYVTLSSAHIAWGQEEAVKVKNGTYSYGNGACKVKANTGSGSIRISG